MPFCLIRFHYFEILDEAPAYVHVELLQTPGLVLVLCLDDVEYGCYLIIAFLDVRRNFIMFCAYNVYSNTGCVVQ